MKQKPYTKLLAVFFLLVLKNTGNAQLCFTLTDTIAIGTQTGSLISADFNEDGKADLASVNGNANNVSVLLGNGNGSFSAPVNFAVGSSPRQICSADFNNDGH